MIGKAESCGEFLELWMSFQGAVVEKEATWCHFIITIFFTGVCLKEWGNEVVKTS